MIRKATVGFLLFAVTFAGCRSSGKQPSTVELATQVPGAVAASRASTPAAASAQASSVELTTKRLPPVNQVAAVRPAARIRQAAYLQPEDISPADSPTSNPDQPKRWTWNESNSAVAKMAPVWLDLLSAIELSLQQNPDLVALRGNERVSEAALGVAQTYPFNPYVQVQATPFQQRPDDRSGPIYHYVLLIQNIQLAHQQRYREEIGSATLNSVRWNIHNAELLNLAQTERLYFTALYLRGVRDLTQTNADLNSQLLSVLQRQLKEGAASGVDVATVRMDNESTQRQARLAETNYQTALLDLKRQLNLPPEAMLELRGDLTKLVWLDAQPERLARVAGAPPESATRFKQESPLEQVVAVRPDVMAAHADIDTTRAGVRLANASRVQDLQIGPYYQRTDSGTQFLGFRAQMDAPIWNSGMPLLRQREAEYRQRTLVWQQLRSRAMLDAGAAIDRYERARALLKAAGTITNQELPLELQKLEEQFLEGEVDVVRLFQARTSTIQNRRAALDTLNEVAQAAAQVTATTAVLPQFIVVPANIATLGEGPVNNPSSDENPAK